MEFLSQYNAQFVYVRGDRNSVADALSRRPPEFCSAEAEKKASRPYPASLSDKEDCVSHIFDPIERALLTFVGALSDVAPEVPTTSLTFSISADKESLRLLRDGYNTDPWTKSLISSEHGMDNLKSVDGLWFLDGRLVVLKAGNLRETLFRLAHDSLGHFGFDKSYESLRHSSYWPRMRRDLESAYVPACVECQQNKSSITKPIGPLHPRPIREWHRCL